MSFLKKKGFWFCVGSGLLLSAALCALLLFLSAFLVYKQLLAQDAAGVISCVCGGVGVFFASLVISKAHSRQGLPIGVMVAAGFLLVSLIVHLSGGESGVTGRWLLWMAVAMFGGGVLGAMVGTGKKTRSRRQHKKNR